MKLYQAVISDIRSTTTVHSKHGQKSKMKNRETYGLSLCIEGQVTYTHNGVDYTLTKDYAAILPMGQTYSIKFEQNGIFPVINFASDSPICDTIKLIKIHNHEGLIAKYKEIQKLLVYDSSRAKILSIFYDMIHDISDEKEFAELGPAIKAIYENYHKADLTNELLAKECNISEIYFRRLFKQRCGVTPKQFIINLRITKAKQLLSEGQKKIWAISEKCGFSSPYHFCRSFKQHTGMTPQEYRERNKYVKI